MDEYYRVPTLALLATLVAVFAALFVRSRTYRTLLWLIGWSMAVVRMAMQVTPYGRHGLGLAVSSTANQLAALMFLGSVSPVFLYVKSRTMVPYIAAFAVPLVVFTVLTSLYPAPGIFLRIVDCAAAIAVVAVGVKWSTQRNLLALWFTVSFATAAGGACLWLTFAGDYSFVLRLSYSAISLMTAVLVLAVYRRLSPGVIFTVTGLLMWTSPMVVDSLLHPGDPGFLAFLRAVNLTKVITAVGMIVLVLEDELIRNEAAQMRDRRVRDEMEQYAKLDIPAVPSRDFGVYYNRICEVITTSSSFCQAAILLRNAEQHFRVVGSAGMDGALAAGLDEVGKRMTPDNLEEFSASGHRVVELGNTAVLDLRPLMKLGDDLERLGVERVHAIPMSASAEGLQGILVLCGLKAPGASLAAEDLLPLELLARRLGAEHESSLLLRRLAQSEKLAGLGLLAGGVAHELNNPLTVVMGYASLIEEGSADEEMRRNGAVIHRESQRMKQTIESLARFWRSSPEGQAAISMEQMLIDICRLRKPELERAGITTELTIARDLPSVRADADQMRQVILQILSNAATAMQNVPAERERVLRINASVVRNRVQVLISDTGPGFSNPDRVFDPFFTTKRPGEGPGLGLSLCYSIVREHGGEISAFNLQPRGAAVSIELPVHVKVDESPAVGEVFTR